MMKKLLFALVVVCFTSTLFVSMVKGRDTKTNAEQKSSLSILNGCWKRVAIIVNGKTDSNPLPQVRLFHDGFFSIIGQDSTGAWKVTFGGTYGITNDIYKEKMLYCTYPGLTGNTHWQNFKIKGDTVSFKLFKKVTDSTGKEIPPPANTRELILVRVKK